jgi:hypothetical protein
MDVMVVWVAVPCSVVVGYLNVLKNLSASLLRVEVHSEWKVDIYIGRL